MQLDTGIVQVSMNLTNYKETSIATVFDAVTREAAQDGVRVLESEIVGLLPADALPADPARRLKLREKISIGCWRSASKRKTKIENRIVRKSQRRAAYSSSFRLAIVTPSSASVSVLLGTIPNALIFL